MKKSKPLCWWIVEDALTSRWGHWLEYLETFRRGLLQLGDSVDIFVSRDCEEEVAALVEGKRTLPPSIWRRMSDGSSKIVRLVRIPLHGWQTYRALAKLLKKIGRGSEPLAQPDIIFVPTVLVHHMLGWLLLRGTVRKAGARVVLFFPNTPIYLDDAGTPRFAPEPTAKLFRFLVRRFERDVASGRFVMAAETEPMTRSLTTLTGVRFIYLPHPVESAPSSLVATQTADIQGGSRDLVFGCYGGARWEKGSDVMQQAIAQLLATTPDFAGRFVFQWLENFADNDGRQVVLDEKLASHPKVEVIRRYFVGDEYSKRLMETDVMLLPYRMSYSLRVSRVVIEAMLAGIPTVITAGTTLADMTARFHVANTCRDGSVNDLVDAIRRVAASWPALSKSAAAAALEARKHFSVGTFRASLLENIALMTRNES
jgi:glycosyltransferase involved in cell wall biosynthesis